jgi:hypothetical protein
MAGIFLGWVNKNAALMPGAKVGEGRDLNDASPGRKLRRR